MFLALRAIKLRKKVLSLIRQLSGQISSVLATSLNSFNNMFVSEKKIPLYKLVEVDWRRTYLSSHELKLGSNFYLAKV